MKIDPRGKKIIKYLWMNAQIPAVLGGYVTECTKCMAKVIIIASLTVIGGLMQCPSIVGM